MPATRPLVDRKLPSPYQDEAAVQRAVWRLLGLAQCGRWWFSQVRKTQQTKGIPDILAAHPQRGMVWIETKHPQNLQAKQTPEQREFERWCIATGQTYLVVRDPQLVADWLGGTLPRLRPVTP